MTDAIKAFSWLIRNHTLFHPDDTDCNDAVNKVMDALKSYNVSTDQQSALPGDRKAALNDFNQVLADGWESSIVELKDATISHIKATLSEAPAWNFDMSSAPRDGTLILVHADDLPYAKDYASCHKITCVARWDDYAGRQDWYGFPLNSHYRVRAWIPLPKPPTAPQDKT